MKNKRLAYVLLPLVLLVWGLIAQRIWFAAMETEPVDGPVAPLPATDPATARLRRPTLLLSYADPFHPLGSAARREIREVRSLQQVGLSSPGPAVSAATSLNLPLAPATVPPPPVVWPAVKYLGLIINSGANNQVVLLAINEQELLVKAGQTNHGVRLVRAFRDSVQLSFSKQRRSFYRAGVL